MWMIVVYGHSGKQWIAIEMIFCQFFVKAFLAENIIINIKVVMSVLCVGLWYIRSSPFLRVEHLLNDREPFLVQFLDPSPIQFFNGPECETVIGFIAWRVPGLDNCASLCLCYRPPSAFVGHACCCLQGGRIAPQQTVHSASLFRATSIQKTLPYVRWWNSPDSFIGWKDGSRVRVVSYGERGANHLIFDLPLRCCENNDHGLVLSYRNCGEILCWDIIQ